MAKFIFRMQGILNIKQKLEDRQKNVYMMAQSVLNEEEARLDSLLKKKENLTEEKRYKMQSSLNVTELSIAENAIKATDLLIEDQVFQVKKAEKHVEIERKKLEDAMLERKTYEKLREKAFERYLEEEEAAERQEVNELVSFRYGNGNDSIIK